jgi:hypothetical protein
MAACVHQGWCFHWVGLGVAAVVDWLLVNCAHAWKAVFPVPICNARLAVVGDVATHLFWSHERLCWWQLQLGCVSLWLLSSSHVTLFLLVGISAA